MFLMEIDIDNELIDTPWIQKLIREPDVMRELPQVNQLCMQVMYWYKARGSNIYKRRWAYFVTLLLTAGLVVNVEKTKSRK